jgi:chromosome partitioning protein
VSVLTLASKGGPGKSTVCMLLAGLRVSALDADPTTALNRWAQNAYEGLPFSIHAEAYETKLAHLIDAQALTADIVLVDTALFGNRAAAIAMTSADSVLIPALSGEADVTEAEKTVGLVEGLARAARPDIPSRVLFNRVKSTHLARHAAGDVAAAKLPTLEAALSDLVAYGERVSPGQVPAQETAGQEIDRLIAESPHLGLDAKH